MANKQEYPGEFQSPMGDALPVEPYSGQVLYGSDGAVRQYYADPQTGELQTFEYWRRDTPTVGPDATLDMVINIVKGRRSKSK